MIKEDATEQGEEKKRKQACLGKEGKEKEKENEQKTK